MSLAEVLIAVLLLTLATTIAAECVRLGTSLFHREMRVSQAQMLMDSLTVSIQDELRYATGIEGTAGTDGTMASFTYSSRNRAGVKGCSLENKDGHIVLHSPESSGTDYELVSTSYYKGVSAELTSKAWDGESFEIAIAIKDSVTHNVITSKEFTVKAFNRDYNFEAR